MRYPSQAGTLAAVAAAMALASGAPLAQAQEARSEPSRQAEAQAQGPEKSATVDADRPAKLRSHAPGVDDADELHDNPDVEKGDSEQGMVADGQHGDHLHWGPGTKPQKNFTAGELVGASVLNRSNEVIGQVAELILDDEDRILGLFVILGEELGLGSRKVAIPWHALQPVRNGEQKFHVVIDADVETLKASADYQRD